MNEAVRYARQGIEILAPAGNEEMLRAAVESGADCVYLGLERFNARRGAGNFDPQSLERAVAFCHGRGAGVYVALNTLLFPQELAEAAHMIETIAQAGTDAVIVQDLGAACLCKRIAPQLPLHGSTQLSVTTVGGARALKELGFSRVILGRELSEEEIALISREGGLETEVFVHGALCMSVSGQCLLSAFLGGRSGNRGMCAGPCRLPYAAVPQGMKKPASSEGCYHLSLRDQSLLPALPRLRELGVASVKIEGRLRTPEYAAAVVDACRKALRGEAYDEELLKKLFSRGDFTRAYYSAARGKALFGVRAPEDAVKTKAALPAVRALYRRPGQFTPVQMRFTCGKTGTFLRVTDGRNTVEQKMEPPARRARAANYPEAAEKSLRKTGGTPFYVEKLEIELPEDAYLPLASVNELRRGALEALLQLREKIWPLPTQPYEPCLEKRAVPADKKLYARFACLENMPRDAVKWADGWYLPLAQAAAVPQELRDKTILEVPRGTFGDDNALLRGIEQAAALGFTRFEANNIGHLPLLKGRGEISAGFGLNVVNPLAAQQLKDAGVSRITLSPEINLGAASFINCGIETGLIAYGHLPLMLTRACPLHNVTGCEGCKKRGGTVLDRKGRILQLRCLGAAREIYNPVPLWMGDRQQEIPCDFLVLYFTNERPQWAVQVLKQMRAKRKCYEEYTRGLYYKSV